MNIYTLCHSCGKEIGSRTFYATRLEHAQHKGEFLQLQCMNCGDRSNYHIDEMAAKASWTRAIIGGFIGLIGTPTIIYLLLPYMTERPMALEIASYASLILVPSTIYTLIRLDDRRRVKSFNQHTVR